MVMIEKIDEFAKNGDKSISGLTLTTGFPRQQKPFRQWMNWIFNSITKKTNEVITDVNKNAQSIASTNQAVINLNQAVQPLFEPIKVGELFITTNDYQSPQDIIDRHGYGTWERFAEARTLVGYSSNPSDLGEYREMGNNFGANTHTLTVDQIPSHNHSAAPWNKFGARASDTTTNTTAVEFDRTNTTGELAVGNFTAANWTLATEKTAGGGQPHNNIQPSIVVAYWLRVG